MSKAVVHKIYGSGGSMGQVNESLKEMMADYGARGKVLAVTSGKGGVGKSNISANLAVCLAAAQKKVLLLDADLSLGNLDVLMGLNSKWNLSHMIRGKKSLSDVVHIGPEGVEVVCSGSGIEELANMSEFGRQRLLEELSKLQNSTDAIVIDTAAGITKNVVGFCLAADHVLVVATPEPTSMTDAYTMIKVLAGHKYAGKISLVVNMAENVAEGKKIYRQISNVVSRFLNIHVYEAGIICRDDKLRDAVRQQKPVVLAHPRCRVSRSLVALASKLGNSIAAECENEGFFRKVVEWFF